MSGYGSQALHCHLQVEVAAIGEATHDLPFTIMECCGYPYCKGSFPTEGYWTKVLQAMILIMISLKFDLRLITKMGSHTHPPSTTHH